MFDPAYPPFEAEIESAPLRAQFTGLKDLIDAVPTITSAVVDAVDTLPPGAEATVSVSVTGGVLHLTFGIPKGEQGDEGPAGPVDAQMLADGLDTRAHAIPAVGTLEATAEPDYSPTQMQDVMNKVDEIVTALKGG